MKARWMDRRWTSRRAARTSALFAGSLCCVLLAGTPASAQGDDASSGEVEVSDEAREQFKIGVALLKDPAGARYEEAYRAFQKAYAISPSPKILGNLGLCAMKLERDSEAIEAFSRYLDQVKDLSPAERQQIDTDLATLKSTVSTVRLTFETEDGAAAEGVLVIDKRVPVQGLPVLNRYEVEGQRFEKGVRAGVHEVRAELDGYEDLAIDFETSPGELVEQTLVFKRPSPDAPPPGPVQVLPQPTPQTPDGEKERPIPATVWIGLAATGAFAIGAGVTGVLALGKQGDFEDANDGSNPQEADDVRSSGQTLNIVTDVLIGGAVVAGAVTAVLFFTRPEVEVGDTAWTVAPSVAPDAGGAVIVGSF